MTASFGWTRQQLLIAFHIYCQLPFGKLHSKNPVIIKISELINRTPSALAMKLVNIASLDPAITSTGRSGLSSASGLDKKMWLEMQSDWGAFVLEMQAAVDALEGSTSGTNKDILNDDAFGTVVDYTGHTKTIESTTRIGQNFFRKAVLSAYDYKCCITGLAIPKLLIASHITPWRVDIANRLNPKNGLCLSMLHDKAFDAGIITISSDFSVEVSRKFASIANLFFQQSLMAYDKKISSYQKNSFQMKHFWLITVSIFLKLKDAL